MATLPESTNPARMRHLSLDALRGLLIVVMALDHANGLIAHGKLAPELWAGSYPDYRGDALTFLTRFVTHLAAPGFFFLMGAGMTFFAGARQNSGWSGWQIIRHFIIRGIILIILQLFGENLAWQIGGTGIPGIYFGVLYALGAALIVGSLLLRLPGPLLLLISMALIIFTEALLPTRGNISVLQRLWLVPGYTPDVFVLYPLMPWLGLTGIGMIFGRWFNRYSTGIFRWSLTAGILMLIGFVVLRAANGYGNIRPDVGRDWITFLNVVKYPPALTFLLPMLGTSLILLSLFHRLETMLPQILKTLAIFGRAPLFFYLTHLALYALAGQLLSPGGMPIPQMFPLWLLGLAILFPCCLWYGKFKHRQPETSLWRLL